MSVTTRSHRNQASARPTRSAEPPEEVASSRFRRLLPAIRDHRANSKPITLPPRKRSAVLVACGACQKARTKCTGDRPACYRCQSKGVTCVYDIQARVSRVASNLGQVMRITDENTMLRELVNNLRTRTWTEAVEILRRVRDTPDLGQVIQFIRDADLIIQR
ncbi:hypothetical protein CONLIGDRAFT_635364 [Coniochaeta ligniaria NRRL 30616]|uniref:Zn(2)-C6 fungal-type domain-containing protein n=1 Tax=Coniochaeta ligniaria NRRL 30616 TaxID=1408157 RepID=A0A1J7ICV1_9PEZI|nr:hypothetical protein CONLIGDRAFT_635364 [Coniochaeta ligniaria NRRL 30616]